MMRSCDESSTTPLTAKFLAPLTERDVLNNCCEVLVLESQCIPKPATEKKKMREKLVDCD